MSKRWIVAILLVVSLLCVSTFRAESRSEWTMKGCYTLDDVTALLNSLPPDRALEAKIVAINSQRSVFGVLSTPYYVWYRR